MQHIVALSGGKDSTAMALWLKENEPRDYQYVWTPTGNELPDMLDHIVKLRDLLEAPILPVSIGIGLIEKTKIERMLPNPRARWCTRKMKLEPYYRWLGQQTPCVSYVGLRADEEERQGMVFQQGNGITLRFPLREAGMNEADVWQFLDDRGVVIPARTDCAICYHQTLGEWWRLWKLHPDLFEEGVQIEVWISELHGKQYTLRNASRDTWPAALADLRKEFEKGRVPPRTVQQIDMFRGERRTMTGACRVCSM
ncbi:phosphoadenosine phosphosulfate reductase family protein [Pseudooceanicola sp. MF1-13]|uniref:phosphoadenosine phosphosulfate reductase domain-containing protein n=1 Tax=Pseudooceanicola sp. MF1-13 TaxID=3379095 RepID=UPI0038911B4A